MRVECPSCTTLFAYDLPACPSCGAPVPVSRGLDPDDALLTRAPSVVATPAPELPDEAPTGYSPRIATGRSATGVLAASGSGPSSSGRFVPGTLLAGRYRIIGLLGRGGMGEVYRAEDLLLAQDVALKFLPPTLSHDPDRLARFRDEVRTARDVSHPNVCRVYDIAEVSGDHFLSMEYIDGEDLASLLRRIGRLPQDKGVEIARQLCAGLAAAHDRGVLHRDLKPANVMIDGRGRVRLADFGLAGAASPDQPGDLAGTPAYMAPEQFQGKPASIQSDLYALGLVLYEIFTGKPVVSGQTVAELARQHREQRPSSMTAIVAELDPAIERVIERCLEKEPGDRPASALSVSAALPGGDPLAAAIARGETPSPELVAAAGDIGFLKPLVALGLIAVVVLGLLTISLVYDQVQLSSLVPLPKPPEVLKDAARQAAETLGYSASRGYTASGFAYSQYVEHLARQGIFPRAQLRTGQPPAILFWYRESRRPMSPLDFLSGARTSPTTPPPTQPGMVGVVLDSLGRLRRFTAVPDRDLEGTPGQLAAPDTAPLFRLLGLDPAKFTAAVPRRVPPVFADRRQAWTGVYPLAPDTPIRIEVASLGSRIVYVDVVEPWDETGRTSPDREGFNDILVPLTFFALAGGAVLLAVRNARLGRGDRRGAFRVALALLGLAFVRGLLGADVDGRFTSVMLLVFFLLSRALLLAALIWVGYLALEPYVRRRWPHMLISWSRMVAGRWRDPLVARDILAGCALGILAQALFAVNTRLANTPTSTELAAFDGARFALGVVFARGTEAVMLGTGILLGLFLLTLVVRRRGLAVALVLLFFGLNSIGNDIPRLAQAAVTAAIVGVLLFGLIKVGLLTLTVSLLVTNLAGTFPLTFNPGPWYAATSFGVMALIVGLSLLAFSRATPFRTLVSRLLSE